MKVFFQLCCGCWKISWQPNQLSFERNLPFYLWLFWRTPSWCLMSCYATMLYFSADFLLLILLELTGILNLWMVYVITSGKFSTVTPQNFAPIPFPFHSSSWTTIKHMLELTTTISLNLFSIFSIFLALCAPFWVFLLRS